MKTPDEIKKGLECCTNDAVACSGKCPYFNSLSNGVDCASKMHADALAYIQQLEKRIIHLKSLDQSNLSTITMQERTRARLMEDISQLEAQVPKWISVEDQPEPPEDDVYYCYGYWIGSGRKQAETAEYSYGEWKIANNFVLTHWMPLPEPPEEDENE